MDKNLKQRVNFYSRLFKRQIQPQSSRFENSLKQRSKYKFESYQQNFSSKVLIVIFFHLNKIEGKPNDFIFRHIFGHNRDPCLLQQISAKLQQFLQGFGSFTNFRRFADGFEAIKSLRKQLQNFIAIFGRIGNELDFFWHFNRIPNSHFINFFFTGNWKATQNIKHDRSPHKRQQNCKHTKSNWIWLRDLNL